MVKKKIHYTTSLAYYKIADFIKEYMNDNTVIVCIGTDKCIGDCLGPLVGTFLKESFIPIPVYGTISDPIHALNIKRNLEVINKKHPNSKIIGIDACLGDESSIGEIQVRNYPIHPGKGVGKSLPNVGSASIIGIVDSTENAEFFTSRNIRLNLIINIANVICHGIIHSYKLSILDNNSS